MKRWLMLVVIGSMMCVWSISINSLEDAESNLNLDDLYQKNEGGLVKVCFLDDGKFYKIGSGFNIDEAGLVVTNYHVVDDGKSYYVLFNDKRMVYVESIFNYDKAGDIALLNLSGEGYEVVELSTSETLKVNDKVCAIGYPLGMDGSVTEGNIIKVHENVYGYKEIIVSAPIYKGSSGGILADESGYVIGITSGSYRDGANNCIPIKYVKELIKEGNLKAATESLNKSYHYEEESINWTGLVFGANGVYDHHNNHVTYGIEDTYSMGYELEVFHEENNHDNMMEVKVIVMDDDGNIAVDDHMDLVLSKGTTTKVIRELLNEEDHRLSEGNYTCQLSIDGVEVTSSELIIGSKRKLEDTSVSHIQVLEELIVSDEEVNIPIVLMFTSNASFYDQLLLEVIIEGNDYTLNDYITVKYNGYDKEIIEYSMNTDPINKGENTFTIKVKYNETVITENTFVIMN